MSEYSKWFWDNCEELNKDTSFAHRLAEESWNHQQAIIDDLRQRSKDEFISITQEWHTKGWNARQGEVDDLKAQLNNMERCYIGKKKECEDQQKRIDEAVAMLTGVCGKVFIGDVVDALRGGS